MENTQQGQTQQGQIFGQQTMMSMQDLTGGQQAGGCQTMVPFSVMPANPQGGQQNMQMAMMAPGGQFANMPNSQHGQMIMMPVMMDSGGQGFVGGPGIMQP